MGNQNTKDAQDKQGSSIETTRTTFSQVFSSTYKAVTRNGETEFNVTKLQSTLFEGFPELSRGLYLALLHNQVGPTSKIRPEDSLHSTGEETRPSRQPRHDGVASDGVVALNKVASDGMVASDGQDRATAEKNITEKTFVDFAAELNEKQLFQDFSDFYFSMFSSDSNTLDEQACTDLVLSCCKSALVLCGCHNTEAVGSQSVSCAVKSMQSQSLDGVLHRDVVQTWVLKHSSRLLYPLHTFVCHRLKSHDLKKTSATSHNEFLTDLLDNKYLLSIATAFLLSCQLSPTFCPSTISSHMDLLSSEVNLPLNCILQGWHLLYNSNAQGLSMNRFQHHVFQYKGPTVTFICFEGHVYCLCITDEWREDSKFWGGSQCSLFQTEPEFKLMQSASDLVFLNLTQRSLPKALQIGSQSRSRILEIDGEFSTVKHYGIEMPLHRIEVWGCGGERVFEEQQKQREWEKKDTQKHKDRKLKIDDWEDSPDRQLLEWGGVKTRHDERS